MHGCEKVISLFIGGEWIRITTIEMLRTGGVSKPHLF